MITSILDSIKKLVGIDPGQTEFDDDILMHINTVFDDLYDVGIGPPNFEIEDNTTTWDAFIGTGTQLKRVKTYIAARVKLMFDPPPNSFGQESMQRQLDELLWRLSVKREGEEWVDQTPRSPSTGDCSSRMF